MSDRYPIGYAALDGMHLVRVVDEYVDVATIQHVALNVRDFDLCHDYDAGQETEDVAHGRLDRALDREDLVRLAQLHGWPVDVVSRLPL